MPENVEKGISSILLYLYLCWSKIFLTVFQTRVRRERTWPYETENRTIGGTHARTYCDGGCGVA